MANKARQRDKLERLCRYIARLAICEKRQSLIANDKVQNQLKTPYRDDTTYVVIEPLDLIARLAALVPRPRVKLTRFHGVFTPNRQHCARITPAKRGKDNKARVLDEQDSELPRHTAFTWVQRLKRMFNIDIETCDQCGGTVKIIACIEDSGVIEKILDHLDAKASADILKRPECRAPSQAVLFH